MHVALPLLAACLAALSAAAPAAAQSALPAQGIGFVQTRDDAGGGSWLCRHEDPLEALSCAQEHCKEQAPGATCVPTAWCYPARWSGVMTMRGAESIETRVLCGVDDKATLEALLAAICSADADAASCALTLTVDPDGNERKVEDVRFAGGAAADDADVPPSSASGLDDSVDVPPDAPGADGAPASTQPAPPPPGDEEGDGP